MMETIRTWRIPAFSTLGIALVERMRGWRIRHFLVWSVVILLAGALTGAMAAILPPLASIGMVALFALVLLWAMPDLHFVPDGLLRKMFFAMVVAQLCVPAYYAIDTGVLPWISVRRFFSLAVIVLFALTIAGSQKARDNIIETTRHNRLLALCTIGFLFMVFLSIFSSRYPVSSLKETVDTILNCYVPFFACILIVRTDEDVVYLLKIISIAAIIAATLGVIEFFLQRRYYFDIFPKSILDAMLSSNPALAGIYYNPSFRNGLYRASSIFTVPLSFGEMAAMTAPIGAYFVFHGQNPKLRLLGAVTVIASILGLLCAGARGGLIAGALAMAVMLFLWTARQSKLNRRSMVSAVFAALFLVGTVAAIGLILSSTRLSNMFLGGGDTVSSNEARFTQWNMALPHILANPVTGNGTGTAGDVIGFLTPGGTPTVDSYIISLLVEVGVPGFLFFAGIVVIGIWLSLKLYLGDPDSRAAIGAPLACSLIAFGVYRLVLSQRENHVLFFLIIGLVFAAWKLGRDRAAARSLQIQPGLHERSLGNYRPQTDHDGQWHRAP